MDTKYFRIQPRVERSTFDAFQHLASSENTDMSKLARRLIKEYIFKHKHKTPA